MKTVFHLITFLLAALPLAAADTPPPIDFVKQIKPIFAGACIHCHNSESLFGNLNLENHDRAFADRKEGPVIILGSPERSPLYQALILPPKDKKAMPASGHKIPQRQIDLIRSWIYEGATWPTGVDGAIPQPNKKKATDV